MLFWASVTELPFGNGIGYGRAAGHGRRAGGIWNETLMGCRAIELRHPTKASFRILHRPSPAARRPPPYLIRETKLSVPELFGAVLDSAASSDHRIRFTHLSKVAGALQPPLTGV